MSQEHIKSSMSLEERARRRASVGKAATEKIAKSEQLNFRLVSCWSWIYLQVKAIIGIN